MRQDTGRHRGRPVAIILVLVLVIAVLAGVLIFQDANRPPAEHQHDVFLDVDEDGDQDYVLELEFVRNRGPAEPAPTPAADDWVPAPTVAPTVAPAEETLVAPTSAGSDWSLRGLWPSGITRWESLLMAAARHYWINTDLLAAVMLIESGGNDRARSSAGAIGLMQIMPNYHSCATWDPAGNIDCGASILAVAIQRHGGAWRPALAEYYAGPTGAAAGRGDAYASNVLAAYTAALAAADALI